MHFNNIYENSSFVTKVQIVYRYENLNFWIIDENLYLLQKFNLFIRVETCTSLIFMKTVHLLQKFKLFTQHWNLHFFKMKFEILILRKKLLPLMFVFFSSQTIFSLILNPPYFRSSPDASACISYSEKWSFFLDYSISYDFCLVSVCSTVLCFFKKCWAFFHTSLPWATSL